MRYEAESKISDHNRRYFDQMNAGIDEMLNSVKNGLSESEKYDAGPLFIPIPRNNQ